MVESLLEIRRVQKLSKPIDVNSVIKIIDEVEVGMNFLGVTFGVGYK